MAALQDVDFEALKNVSKAVAEWVRGSNPPPAIFTIEEIKTSLDVFPIEFLDIIENRKILYGSDPFGGLEVHNDNLRHELEHEFKSKLLRLKELYMLEASSKRNLEKIIIKSFSSFTALFKGVLRLLGEKPPAKKIDVVEKACERIGMDPAVFRVIHETKEGVKPSQKWDIQEIAGRYMAEIFKAGRFVDEIKN